MEKPEVKLKNYNAFIFTLGNEVVQGRVVNTNAAYLGRRLTVLGFRVIGNASLVDDVDIISNFIRIVIKEYEPSLIVTTGGLGPTYDDRTLEAVSRALNIDLVLNDDALRMIKKKYEEGGMELTEERIKMAYLPKGAEPIPNYVGTAPGSWLNYDGRIIISLPGVPRELEAMWEKWVEPRLIEIGPKKFVYESTITIVGIPESGLAPLLKAIVKQYPDIYVKSHPSGHEVRGPIIKVYFMTSSDSKSAAQAKVEEAKKYLISRLGELGFKYEVIG